MAERKYPVISRDVLSIDELAALGTVAAESSYLEKHVELVIGDLLGITNEQRDATFEKVMLSPKIDILVALAKPVLSVKANRRFTSIIKRVRATNDERVAAVHGIWWKWPIGGQGSALQMASAKHHRGNVTAAALDDLSARINADGWDLFEFWIREIVVPRRGQKGLKDLGIELPDAP